MTPPSELRGCYLKLKRAQEHIASLEKGIATFLDGADYGFEEAVDPNTGETVWRTTKTPPVPPGALSPILGDTLYNLRSALDHLAWQLVLRAGGNPSRRTEFPIFKEREAFHARAPGKLDGMNEEMRFAIEAAQPFRVARPIAHPLWWLQELCNTDKHRHLHLTVSAIQGTWFDPPLPYRVESYSGPLEGPTELVRFPKELGRVGGSPLIGVSLEGSEPYCKYGVMGAVSTLIGAKVQGLTDSFATRFFASAR